MREIDRSAVKAKSERDYREEFLCSFEAFVLQTAHKVTNRYITKSDDTWSVAFFAFNEAIDAYELDKGSFIPFAEMVIRRRLYDHIRKESRADAELLVDPICFSGQPDPEAGDVALFRQVVDKTSVDMENRARWEIEAISQVLDSYGFCFMDLVSVSPKAKKTKTACARAVAFLMDHPDLMERMKTFKTLPATAIEKNLKIPRKILDRHRKYIIAAAEIVSGDYPVLSEYMTYIKKELSK
jgi:RNA polymerase sigma factor